MVDMLLTRDFPSELYGGPSQPEILDPRGTVRKAHLLGKNDSEHYINPGQYDNESVGISLNGKTLSTTSIG